jgi:hypothetical protein
VEKEQEGNLTETDEAQTSYSTAETATSVEMA